MLLLTLLCFTFELVLAASAANPTLATVTYWGTNTNYYDTLPPDTIAIINPYNGIFTPPTTTLVPDLAQFQAIAKDATNRGVQILGYVPTGYFNHNCNQDGVCQTLERIEAQVEAYYQNFDALTGIFFDEVGPNPWNCNAFSAEYARLRTIVRKYSPDGIIAYNTGTPDNCVAGGLQRDEIVVNFENSLSEYNNNFVNVAVSTMTIQATGAKSWHLVYDVPSQSSFDSALASAVQHNADFFFATSYYVCSTCNVWEAPPSFWMHETCVLANYGC